MKTFSFTITCFLFFAFQAIAQYTPFFPEELVVTANTLNLREAPDKNSNKVASLQKGSVVQYLEAWNNGQWVQSDTTDPDSPYAPWIKVNYQGKTGYVFGAYVTGTTGLYHEGDFFFNPDPLPSLNWYGLYRRDSFADELRPIIVRLEEETNEFYGEKIRVLKTNQKEESKFIIGSLKPMKTGYAGPLGQFEVRDMFLSGDLAPGNTVSIHPGGDMNTIDTTMKPSYILTATGCARMENNEYLYVRVTDYQLTLLDYSTQPPYRQDLTPWVKTESEEMNPSVRITWYGDLDMDGKPDAILNDCPYEMGCRDALFLSSKARPGEALRKVCEHFWPGD
ncbi:MAG: SH3 domain-containing protein [Lewinellaceae bacterium]|nr:SH3 domain-containing protein [Lewinellaceae bacterium]